MSDDLVKRLRDRGVCSLEHNSCRNDMACDQAADRIEKLEAKLERTQARREELEELLWEAENDAKEAEDYAGELEAVLESIKAKLATCEKYRDAYAECDRIGTQAVRDLEANLAKAVEALQQLVIEYDEVDLAYDEPKSMTAAYGVALDTLAELTRGKDE